VTAAPVAPLDAVPLLTPDGEPASLAAFAGDALVIQLVRYFGCLPCQVYLRSLDARQGELAAMGVRAVAVGGSADYQARWLRETGVTMPLLLDPEQRLRAQVGMGSLSARQLLAPRGVRAYLGAVAAGVRPRRPTLDATRSPGIAVTDRRHAVRWSHEGAALGDYPPLGLVLDAAARVGGDALP
jgi:peroxiredoxin